MAVVDRRRQPPRKPRRPVRPENTPVPRVGRRPSAPGLLFAISAMWIAAGIFVLVTLTAGWKLIPGVVSIGIGALYLRGAVTTVARRSDG